MHVRTLVLIAAASLALPGCSSSGRHRHMPTAPVPPAAPATPTTGEPTSSAVHPPEDGAGSRQAPSAPTPAASGSPASPVAETTPPVPAPVPHLAGLYQEALTATRSGRHNEALRCWEQLWSACPEYEDVSELLKREYQVRGLESFAVGKLDEAVQFWKKALAIDSQDRRTRAYIERADELRERSTQILQD